MHIACLSYSVAPVLRLFVHGGVPVSIVEDHHICPGQINPQSPAPGGRNKAEDPRVQIEHVYDPLSLLHSGAPVKAHIGMSVDVHETLQDVQHSRHLCKNHALVAAFFQVRKKQGELTQLAAVVFYAFTVRKAQVEGGEDRVQCAH